MLNRRHFLMSATTAVVATPLLKAAPASERVRVGVVGLAGQGQYNWGQLAGVPSCEVVSICDVDESRTGPARKQFPKAAFFTDFRKMIDAKGLDAVLCATPDHNHFHVTHRALSEGLHAYCEKPLTHTVWEARTLAELAAKNKLVTQMGTQIHAGDNYRRVVEIVKKGVIGPIREAHCWVGGAYNGNGKRPAGKPIPAGLDWQLWLGPAEERDYAPEYVPFNWRRYWAFGGGKMTDMACHHMDLAFWALDLRHPTKVSAQGSKPTPESAADWIECEFEFPARGSMPPVKVTWHDGDRRPPQFADGKLPKWGDGTLFVGEKGMILADYGRKLVLPEADFKGIDGDHSIPKSIGHHKEWIEAIKSGGTTTCRFEYSGALAETVMLGVVSYRTGKPFGWDAKELKAKGVPEADGFIKTTYKKGWEV
ncbi:MAG TPA: Gfo/Idh/MocA family oxidoreductase [Gemmataceae bacterium]|jgi:predicted dehydrogenase|nr:Gfo/Idh/MocA family oxidoreductase [Gemmataceae bacterium]